MDNIASLLIRIVPIIIWIVFGIWIVRAAMRYAHSNSLAGRIASGELTLNSGKDENTLKSEGIESLEDFYCTYNGVSRKTMEKWKKEAEKTNGKVR